MLGFENGLGRQCRLGRMRVEYEGVGTRQLVSAHDTLDEAVDAICGLLEEGGRLVLGARFVIVDDETGETHTVPGHPL